MAFLEGSKAVSTSIGGSTQTINFTPVLNARGATSGGTVGGLTTSNTPTVSVAQTSGGEPSNGLLDGQAALRGGLMPRLRLIGSPGDEISPIDRGYLSPQGFAPASFTSDSPGRTTNMLLIVAALAGLAFFLTR